MDINEHKQEKARESNRILTACKEKIDHKLIFSSVIDLSNQNLGALLPEHLSEVFLDIAKKLPFHTDLDISNNGLKTLPAEISTLTTLAILHLEGNELTTLPDSLLYLKNLHTLDISRNKFPSFPAIIEKMTNLRSLSASGNNFTFLPSFIGKLEKIVWLLLSFNQLRFLPSEIGNLSKLKYLNISNNALRCLPSSLEKLDLNFLNITKNQLHYLPAYHSGLGRPLSLPRFGASGLKCDNITVLPIAWINRKINNAGSIPTTYPLSLIETHYASLKLLEDNFKQVIKKNPENFPVLGTLPSGSPKELCNDYLYMLQQQYLFSCIDKIHEAVKNKSAMQQVCKTWKKEEGSPIINIMLPREIDRQVSSFVVGTYGWLDHMIGKSLFDQTYIYPIPQEQRIFKIVQEIVTACKEEIQAQPKKKMNPNNNGTGRSSSPEPKLKDGWSKDEENRRDSSKGAAPYFSRG